ncbi:transporter substrate-binding domain-containing protein [Aestuariibacter halophilus]|uniref:Transporter substrate-binding domain-containing protein n=1 Tax=Fluctibacter halophilus TaxID=226011 RepID=A0ABS8G9E9_9ALTE|nr:transporter substrate-binding domain-containing protein [Aestuariibacter halophilus]MCC2617073.1 transporter substrate-binding domain-containing protein [Aestuariibacter halophilus]
MVKFLRTLVHLWLWGHIAVGGMLVVEAKNLDVAVGWTKPPYVIADGNTGFELDLVRSVFRSMGHDITPIYVPFGRSQTMLKEGMVDLTLTMTEQMGIPSAQLSDEYVVYQNVAISLKSSKLAIDSIEQLHHHTVVAFQNASLVLGDEYRQAVEQSRLYIELPEQRRQVEMLLMGNAAVAVMDINIFIHLSRVLTGENQLYNVNVHKLFPATPYRVGFKDAALKEAFNLALARFMASDQYQWLKYNYAFYDARNAAAGVNEAQ